MLQKEIESAKLLNVLTKSGTPANWDEATILLDYVEQIFEPFWTRYRGTLSWNRLRNAIIANETDNTIRWPFRLKEISDEE